MRKGDKIFNAKNYFVLVDHDIGGGLPSVLQHLPKKFDVREVDPRLGNDENRMVIITLKDNEQQTGKKDEKVGPKRGEGDIGREHPSPPFRPEEETQKAPPVGVGASAPA